MANIILKDKSGAEIEYSNVKCLNVPNTDGGTQSFVEGNPTTKEIELDFTDGHMVVPADDGTVMTEVTINRPANLIPANIVDGVKIAGIEGNATVMSEGSALVYTAVKTFNVTPYSSSNSTLLASASELAACGIDLTQYTSWYQSGQVYVPFIKLTKLKSTGTTISTSYRCITDAWISNMKQIPTSGSDCYVGDIMYDNESGKYALSNPLRASVPGTATNPLAKPFSYASTNQLLYVSNGNVYATLYYSSSVRYGLYGTYLVTVMLIPAA